jgi:hypothetical protein
MSLSIGIVGLPNVGKSTTFNALCGAQHAQVANFPFTTIHPNRAIVPLPDPRVEKLADLVNVPNKIHATLEFVDIAGLVKGASRGEGLGNQFLDQIRNTNAIVHVVRCFDDPNVVHINEQPEPRSDIEIINVELALADLQQLERKIERLSSAVKGNKKLQPVLDLAHDLRRHLQEGRLAAHYPQRDSEAFHSLEQEMRFLTSKTVIIAANVDETDLASDNDYVKTVRKVAVEQGAEVVVLCAKLEEAMVDMSAEEKQEFLELAGVNCCGLDQVIRKSFAALNLISFFTKNENEVRAWNIQRGTHAPQAAGAIHTDFERGFIRAEVIPFTVYEKLGSDHAVKTAGLMRLEGKEYVVQDGDVVYFRINV